MSSRDPLVLPAASPARRNPRDYRSAYVATGVVRDRAVAGSLADTLRRPWGRSLTRRTVWSEVAVRVPPTYDQRTGIRRVAGIPGRQGSSDAEAPRGRTTPQTANDRSQDPQAGERAATREAPD